MGKKGPPIYSDRQSFLFDLNNLTVNTMLTEPVPVVAPVSLPPTGDVPEIVVTQVAPVWRPYGHGNFYIQRTAQPDGTAYYRNLDALTTLARLRKGAELTEPDRLDLADYAGWGFDPNLLVDDKHGPRIAKLMTAEEIKQAKALSLYAFFTPVRIARWMWAAAVQMGFSGGNVLEPAMGNGVFMGTVPSRYIGKVRICGVEPDALCIEMARYLYPDAWLVQAALEDAKLPTKEFDLALGNVPFGDVPVFDPNYPKFVTHSIHNYIIARALDLVRPGGLAALVTSRFTLDAVDPTFRNYLAERADLVHVVRTPPGTFGGTEAIADVLFLRKQGVPAEIPVIDPEIWTVVEAKKFITGGKYVVEPGYPYGRYRETFEEITLNKLFHDTPYEPTVKSGAWMCGIAAVKSGQFGPTLDIKPPTMTHNNNHYDTSHLYTTALEHMPSWEWTPPIADVAVTVEQYGPHDEDGTYVVKKGNEIWQWQGEALHRLTLGADAAKRTISLIDLRDKARAVLAANSEDDATLAAARAALAAAYDAFHAQHGPLNRPANKKLLKGDPGLPFLCSIEEYDDETDRASKTSIFDRRILVQDDNAVHCSSVEEGLVVSLNRKGRIDIDYIASLCEISAGAAATRLKGVIFEDPADGWQLREVALAGNVRDKLERLAPLLKSEPHRWGEYAEALKGVMPASLTADEITIPFGAAWIPSGIVNDFVKELQDPGSDVNKHVTGPKGNNYRSYSAASVRYNESMGMWTLESITNFRTGDLATRVWGTNRMEAVAVLEHALNNKQPHITTETVEGKRVFDEVATVAAKEKIDAVKTAWARWLELPKNEEHMNNLVRVYNEKFNSYVRQLPIEHEPPFAAAGMRADAPKLRAYQKRAIWRLVQGENLLLWHGVGAGKSLSMFSASMILKRTGLRQKPMHVVPNHLVEQYCTDFYRFFPGARLLVISSDTTNSKNRAEMLARIATGSWDAVIVSQSAFALIPVSSRTWDAYVEARVEILEKFKKTLGSEDRRTLKQVEKEIQRLKVGIRELRAEVKPGMLCFEELGVDLVFYDESHALKNLGILSQMTLPGLIRTESTMARDAFIKFQWLTRRCDTCGEMLGEKIKCCGHEPKRLGQLCLSTGTAVTNSIAELYNVQRFIQYGELLKRGVAAFDAWASVFGEAETFLELKPTGTGWRINTRFARFHNVPDLLNMLATACDAEFDLAAAGVLLPFLKGSEPEAVECPSCEELEILMADCASRAEYLKENPKCGDSVLAIMGDALKGALDLRLIDPELEDWEGSKISMAATRIAEIYHASTGVMLPNLQKPHNLAQAVFLDMGVPGGANFNLYKALRDKLVALGVKRDEIAFAHEAKNDQDRALMFRRVNAGIIRVIIGSTKKMGTGANMQRLLAALHHIDVPWTPADVEQREGRIVRSGNLVPEIRILRYATKKSLDFYKWHLLAVKAHFIAQVVKAGGERKCADLEDQALSFDQMKAIATGDPMILEQVALEQEHRKLSMLYTSWEQEQRRLEYERIALPGRIERTKNAIAYYERMVESFNSNPIVVGSKEFDPATMDKQENRKELGLELGAWVEAALSAAGNNGLGAPRGKTHWGMLRVDIIAHWSKKAYMARWWDGGAFVSDITVYARAGDTGNRTLELREDAAKLLFNARHNLGVAEQNWADVKDAPPAIFQHATRLAEINHRLAEIDRHFREEAAKDAEKDKNKQTAPLHGQDITAAPGALVGAAMHDAVAMFAAGG